MKIGSMFVVVVLLFSGALAGTSHAIQAKTETHSGSPMLLEAVGKTVFFRASNGAYRKELWKSSGTRSSTVLVKDINPTDCPGGCRGEWGRPGSFTNVGGLVFFIAAEDGHDFEVWRSDGSEQGTVRLTDLRERGGILGPTSLTAMNGMLFFSAYDGEIRRELWRSDGTVEGTVMVKDINPKRHGGSSTRQLTKVGNTLFFTARDGSHGSDVQLWKSDGTAEGTEMVADITPGEDSSFIHSLTNLNGTLFFVHGTQLWKSDGTSEGTVMVKDFTLPTSASGLPSPRFMKVSGELYFSANDGVHGSELWKTDGTGRGTTMVRDINRTGPSFATPLGVAKGMLFFAANDGGHGFELYRTTESGHGAALVKDIWRGEGNGLTARKQTVFTEAEAVGKTLVFVADDGTRGQELWRTDGTRAGTRIVADIRRRGNATPKWLTNARGRLFFSAYTPRDGRELWISDGTAAGTTLVRDIWR